MRTASTLMWRHLAATAKRLPTAVILIALSHLALELCQNFLPVVYPLLIESMGLTYAQVGTMALVGSIFGSLMQPLFGYLSDRLAPSLIIFISIAWSGTAMGLLGPISHYGGRYWMLLPIIGIGALGSAAYHPAGASMATAGVSRRRGAALSIFSVGGNLGAALSPLIIGVGLAWIGLRGTAVLIPIAVLISFLLYQQIRWLPTPTRVKTRPIHDQGSETKQEARTGSWVAIGLIILIVASRSWFQGAMMTYLPEWLASQGSSLEVAGSIYSIMLISVSVGSFTGGSLSDLVGRVPIAVVSLGLLGPLLWIFMQTTGPLQVLFVGLIGVMIGATFPVTIVMAQEVWPQTVGLASALVLGLGWLPAGLSAWVTGLIADKTSLTSALSLIAFVPLLGVLAAATFAQLQRR